MPIRYLRLFVSLLATLALLLGPTTTSAQASPPKQVLVLGDSIVGGASNYIGFYLGYDGRAQTTIRSVGGTALCDVLQGSGGPWTIDGLLAAKRYDAVIVAFSGNNMTRCMEGRTGQAAVDKYRADAEKFMHVTRFFGVPKVIWVQPPAAASPSLDYIRTGLATLYRTLPAYWPTARVLDGGAGLEDHGRWARYLPCAPWDKPGCYAGWVPIGHDDGVHFWCGQPGGAPYGVVQPCKSYSAGSNRYGMNIGGARAFI